MTRYKDYNVGARGQNPFGTFGPILIMVLVLFVLFYAVKGLFTILSFVAPVLLIATLIIDRKVIFDYVKFIGKLLKENTLVGILGVILTILGWHVVSGFLFAKAIMKRSLNKAINNMEKKVNPDFTEYEEVLEDEDFLELPKKVEVVKNKTTQDNDYNDLFK